MRVRVADRFKRQSAEQLVTMAGAVITGLTNNPAFPTPGPEVNNRSIVLGVRDPSSWTVPSYSAPIAIVVKRAPFTTILDPATAPSVIFRPSISSATMPHAP